MVPSQRADQRLRVLYLRDQLYSAHGGTEQHLHWLLKNLPEGRYEKHFAVLSTLRCDTSTWPVRTTVISEEYGVGPYHWHKRLLAVVRLIRDHKIDIVHTFCPMSECVALLTRLFGCHAEVIGSRRNTGYCLTRFGAIRSRMLQRFNVTYVANSKAAKAHAVAQENISPKRITVIPNPVCEQRIVEGTIKLNCRSELADEDTLIVAMVATVRPVKDHATFIRAARIVADVYPKVKFVSVGESDESLLHLKDLTHKLGLDADFIWYGGVENIFSLLSHFDVGVLSSRSESFSNAVLEYAVAGLPSVVTDVGDLDEIVLDGKTGFVVPSGCPEALASKILELLKSPSLRVRFGAAARDHVSMQFAESTVLNAYETLYMSVARHTNIASISDPRAY